MSNKWDPHWGCQWNDSHHIKAWLRSAPPQTVGAATRKCLGIIDGVAFARHPRRVGATFIANTALGMMAARALCEGDTRWPVALMTTAFGVGQIVGPTFAGVFHDILGSFLVPSLIAVAGLLVGAVLVARLKAPGI